MGGTVTALCPAGMPTTELTIKAIDAQGVLGRITTKNVGYVSSRTIDHALKGHAVYIPGAVNRFIRFLGSLVPPVIVSNLIGRRWSAAHKKSHASSAAENHGLEYEAGKA
jgi:short-subunit dehydrogenase